MRFRVRKIINFLDLIITKTDNGHTFNVYKKPIITISVICNTSSHCTQQKHAAFLIMINRLLSIPLKHTEHDIEDNTIKYITQENGYGLQFFETLVKIAS